MVPLPRSHCQLVGLPVDRSVKFTRSGAQPDIGVAEKFALNCALQINAWESKIKSRSHLQLPALRTTIGFAWFLLGCLDATGCPVNLLKTEIWGKNCVRLSIYFSIFNSKNKQAKNTKKLLLYHVQYKWLRCTPWR